MKKDILKQILWLYIGATCDVKFITDEQVNNITLTSFKIENYINNATIEDITLHLNKKQKLTESQLLELKKIDTECKINSIEEFVKLKAYAPEVSVYLAGLHMDIFGLIDRGFAIEKLPTADTNDR